MCAASAGACPPGAPQAPRRGSAAPLSLRRACRHRPGLLEETARRRLDALSLEAVVAQLAALEAGELLALARHLRPRLVASEEPPAPEAAERIVRMSSGELQELVQRLRERLAQG